jgi:hypothetical protein
MQFKSLARRRYESIFDSYDDPAEQQRLVKQRQVMKRIGRRILCSRLPGQR